MKNGFSLHILLPLLCLVLFSSACRKTPEKKVNSAFYHWKTTLDISALEENYMETISAKRLYLRFFDLDWDGTANEPLPIASVEVNKAISDSIEIVPVVFITNRTFLQLADDEIPQLAENVLKKIFQLLEGFPGREIKELQFDCDWSPQTHSKYFEFLTQIGIQTQEKSIRLSSTIRLHQVKYFVKTGVPPVDRGALMFYNMGNVEDVNAENSILDLSIAKQYLENFDKYPLPLDIALPLFSWAVLIREGKMTGLINNLQASDLQDELRFSKIDESHFEVIKSTYLQGYYLYRGDVLRLETVSVELLQESADLLGTFVSNSDLNLIFYHLDSIVINNYPHEILEDICNRFR